MYDVLGTVWGIQLEMAIFLSNNATMANIGCLLKPEFMYSPGYMTASSTSHTSGQSRIYVLALNSKVRVLLYCQGYSLGVITDKRLHLEFN
jgi:hypothetical protein